ncbi:MAG: PKD domain-containing protein [Chitinophagaceae bacterium]|nr:MAG: PKD domain-containing protein [Chitinophagaceae bacterium]
MQNQTFRALRALSTLALVALASAAGAQPKRAARTTGVHAAFTASATSGCVPLLVHFQDASTGGATQWRWELGNGVTSTQQNPATLYNQPGTYHVRLVVRNSAGADSVLRSDYIRVTAGPATAFSVSDSVGCLPFTTSFRDGSVSDSAIVSRAWDFGDGTLGTGISASHTYTRPGTYAVTLKVTNSAGCSSVLTKAAAVRVAAKPLASFTATDTAHCAAPARVAFAATGSGLQYRWDFGDGTTGTGSQAAHTYVSEGVFSVRLVVTNATGCSDTILRTGLVRIGADARFSAPDTVCAGSPVAFTNTGAPRAIAQQWSFGDGRSATAFSPVVTYSTAGTYTVTLVNNYGHCTDSMQRLVTVLAVPKAGFVSADTSSCAAPFRVSFVNTSTGAAGYAWDFGDGTGSADAAPVHTYTAPGHYTVRLVVTGAGGCSDTLVRTSYIRMQLPSLQVSGTPVSGCAPQTITPQATAGAGERILSYDWDFGDGSHSALAAPQHVYTQNGTYALRLTVTLAGGCTQTITVPAAVRVYQKPQAAFTFTPPVSCAREGVAFHDASTGTESATTYAWSFGDGATSAEQHPGHTYGNAGLFSVQLIVANGTCSDTARLNDTVRILPPIAIMSVRKDCADPYTRGFRDRSVGALTWEWSFGDGQVSASRNPDHTYAQTGTYVVKLRVTNGNCFFETSETVKIIDEKARFAVPSDPVCKGAPVTIPAVGIASANIASWKWEMGDGAQYATAGSVTHTYASRGRFAVRLTITDLNGCSNSFTDSITTVGPLADFRVTDPLLCLQPGGAVARFSDRSAADTGRPITAYHWNFGDGGVDSSGNTQPSNRYLARGVYTVALTVRDVMGCTDRKTLPAAVRVSRPVAAFAAADTAVCLRNDVVFQNNTTGASPFANAWSFGDGSVASTETPTHTYASTGIYTVQLQVTDTWGCRDTLTRPSYIRISVPRARFSMSDTVASCPPLQVQFSNGSTDFSTQHWDFGNGNGSVLNAPAHVYNTAGVFRPRLVVTGTGGCSDTLVRTVIVKGPSGVIQYDPDSGCSPVEVSFSASTRNRDSLVWDFGDGQLAAGVDSVLRHTYRDTGSFVPRLLLFDRSGCSVVVNGADTIRSYRLFPAFAADSKSFCDSGKVRFTGLSTGNDRITGWLWEFGDGTTDTTMNPVHHYTRPGRYDVRLTNRGGQGCEATGVAMRVTVNESPRVAINMGRDASCVPALFPAEGRLLRADTGIVVWSWTLGDGRTASGRVPGDFAYNIAGTYPVTLQVRDANGCTRQVTDTVTARPLPAVDAGADFVLCRDSARLLRASGAQVYRWSASPWLDCVSCPSPRVSAPQTARFYVTGTDAFGCSARDSVLVTVQQRLPLQLLSRPDSLCAGSSVTLQAAGAEQYQWLPANNLDRPLSDRPVARPDQTTTFTVIGRDAAGCFADTARLTLTVFPVPQVSAGPDLELRAGDTATLRAGGSADITSWRWSPSGQLSCSTCPQPVVKAGYSSPLRLVVRNAGGCTATADMRIIVTCGGGNIFLPNTFSPNADGMNERFYPRGKGLSGIRSFRVFNRWGQVVYEKLNFNANDPLAGWDGTFGGKTAPADVYVYTCEVVCSSGEVIPVKGDVTLLR